MITPMILVYSRLLYITFHRKDSCFAVSTKETLLHKYMAQMLKVNIAAAVYLYVIIQCYKRMLLVQHMTL